MNNTAPDNWRELYRIARLDPCGEWMVDLTNSTGEIDCELPKYHDGSHMSFTKSKAWGDGLQSNLWFRENGFEHKPGSMAAAVDSIKRVSTVLTCCACTGHNHIGPEHHYCDKHKLKTN